MGMVMDVHWERANPPQTNHSTEMISTASRDVIGVGRRNFASNKLFVDEDEIAEYGRKYPQPYQRDEYLP